MTTAADSELEDLCLGLWNINGLKKKTSHIKSILERIDVLALTETRLNDRVEKSILHIPNFEFYKTNRKGRWGGGVGLYIKKPIEVTELPNLYQQNLEIIWVEIYLSNTRPMLVGCCYRPPKSKIEYFNKICREIEMKTMSNEDRDVFLLGDFNINLHEKKKTKKKISHDKKTRIDFVSYVCGLTQIVNKPTRVNKKQSTSTCIDHIYTNISELCYNLHSSQVEFVNQTNVLKKVSDHNLIICTVNRKVPRQRNTETDAPREYLNSSLVCYGPSLSEFLIKKKIMENKHSEFTLENNWFSHPDTERINHMKEYFKMNHLFTCHPTLDRITDQWISDLDNNKQVGVVFMDFSFPSDDQRADIIQLSDLLIPKLESYGFSVSAISMIRSFLSDRNSSSSCQTESHCELQQGPCMTHFLFSVYTNDLKHLLESACVVVSGSKLMIYHSADYEVLKKVLRDESEVVRCWLRENRMDLKMFTSARIRSKTQLKKIIQKDLKCKLTVAVEECNWIEKLVFLLHDAPHLVWPSQKKKAWV